MTELQPLTEDQIYHRCPPEQLDFDTTRALEELDLPYGQDRVLRALEFGTAIQSHGFNLFVLGPSAAGKHEVVRQFLHRRAEGEPTPPDWCLLFNFESPDKPRAARLPAGQGRRLKEDLDRLVEELRSSIPAAFESEEYQSRLQELQEEMARRQHQGIRAIQEEANRNEIALITAPSGFTFAPTRDGDVLDPDDFQKLSDHERTRIENKMQELQQHLQQTIQQVPRLRKELQQKIRELNEEMVSFTLGGPINELKDTWEQQKAIVNQLDAIREHLVEQARFFTEQGGSGSEGGGGGGPPDGLLNRCRVNLLVDNGNQNGAPVIYEDLPNHQHLVGLIEHQVHQGALYTDFSMVRSGALHRANGGYLMLDVRRVLLQPMAWESLKRVLSSGEICIESLERLYGLVSTVSLQPEPIPVHLKVVLLGDRILYYLLAHYDPDFLELFKVQADFEDEIDRTNDGYGLYARMVGTLARQTRLRPLDRGGVARVIEHASRLADDQKKLTGHDRALRDLLMEAEHWAEQAGAPHIGALHVEQAIDEQLARADRLRRQNLEQIRRGTVLIATEGERTGQVNGLSVIQLGAYRFGRPSRITATARPGRGQVIDIEREAKLGGPIHSKSVMILSRFLASRYAGEGDLSLSASLAFEQSYGGVEGDSASVAETCALLSAITRVPLRQSLAVTGSMNQHGEIQAVGGVNEKIEGFFEVCREAGAVNHHGVLLPAGNVEHLMLRRDVREAVAAGHFSVYAIRSLDEAIALLTGLPAGAADAEGRFPPDTFNRRVADRLAAFAEISRKRNRRGNGETEENGETGDDGETSTNDE